MPLLKGKRARTKKGLAKNAHELRHGPQFKKTAKKHGKKKALKQMIAIMLSAGRRKGARKK